VGWARNVHESRWGQIKGEEMLQKEHEPVYEIVVCKAVGRGIISLNPMK
jgi:hypothetical protein